MVVFDKTGTLTKGVFKVQEINAKGISKEKLLELTAYAENYSNHPISISLKQAYNKKIDESEIADVEEISGHGVRAVVKGKTVYAGNTKLMKKIKVPYYKGEIVGTVVHVAVDDKYAGYIVIADEVKPDAAKSNSRIERS